MTMLSNLADLVTVRNHLRMLLDSQYRRLDREKDKVLNKLITDLDRLFINSMSASAGNPGAFLDPYEGPKPEEIIEALKKTPIAVPGAASVVNPKQLELDFEQKKKVARGKSKVKANKEKAKKQRQETLDKEAQEMNEKISRAKQEVVGRKKATAIKPKGDGRVDNES